MHVMVSITCITRVLHALHAITCIPLLHPDRLRALYAPYTPCHCVFLPPKDESLTQTSPATAHLVPRPPAAAANWFARNCAAWNQVPEFTRPNPRAPRGQRAHCGLWRLGGRGRDRMKPSRASSCCSACVM